VEALLEASTITSQRLSILEEEAATIREVRNSGNVSEVVERAERERVELAQGMEAEKIEWETNIAKLVTMSEEARRKAEVTGLTRAKVVNDCVKRERWQLTERKRRLGIEKGRELKLLEDILRHKEEAAESLKEGSEISMKDGGESIYKTLSLYLHGVSGAVQFIYLAEVGIEVMIRSSLKAPRSEGGADVETRWSITRSLWLWKSRMRVETIKLHAKAFRQWACKDKQELRRLRNVQSNIEARIALSYVAREHTMCHISRFVQIWRLRATGGRAIRKRDVAHQKRHTEQVEREKMRDEVGKVNGALAECQVLEEVLNELHGATGVWRAEEEHEKESIQEEIAACKLKVCGPRCYFVP